MHDNDSEHSHNHGDGEVIYETRLTSVGIDIGSSTTHLTFSQLVVGRLASHFHRKPEILRRTVLYRSPILFTPFLEDGRIDDGAIQAFVEKSYAEAGVSLEAVHSGAVICTGEAARRDNARAITEALAKDTGRFVCATAGHHFEAALAAHGSGSVVLSHQFDEPVVNLDIGGGTAKRSVIRRGIIESSAAINIGARLIAVDADGRVVRAEAAGLDLALAAGVDAAVGRSLSEDDRWSVARVMAGLLADFIGGGVRTPLGQRLLLTEAPAVPDETYRLICSGGVSEFIYGNTRRDTGDLGAYLGPAFREELRARGMEGRLHSPTEGIRATVIGAGQFTLQVSGETVYATRNVQLPINNLTVAPVALDWRNVTEESVAEAITATIAAAEEETIALAFGGPARFGYSTVEPLARGIVAAFRRNDIRQQTVLVFSQNMAGTLGLALRDLMPSDASFLCLDELDVGKMDYLDVGPPPDGETYFPVVVKSLVFK